MTAEEESKNNGGLIVPPESEAERLEEDGRPASLSSDGIQDETTADEEANLTASTRLSREELERKYRNDPRFDMLFHHEKKLGQKGWYIKVGGIRLTVMRILILSGVLLVFLICLGACF